MRKLILEEWLSLDGFALDKDRRLDFFPASETDKFSDRDQLSYARLKRVNVRAYDTGVVFLHYEPQPQV